MRRVQIFAGVVLVLTLGVVASCGSPLYLGDLAATDRTLASMRLDSSVHARAGGYDGSQGLTPFIVSGSGLAASDGELLMLASADTLYPNAVYPDTAANYTGGADHSVVTLPQLGLSQTDPGRASYIISATDRTSPADGTLYIGYVVFGDSDPAYNNVSVTFVGDNSPYSTPISSPGLIADILTPSGLFPSLQRIVGASFGRDDTGALVLYLLAQDVSGYFDTAALKIDPASGEPVASAGSNTSSTVLSLQIAGNPTNGFYVYDRGTNSHYFSYLKPGATKLTTIKWKNNVVDPDAPTNVLVSSVPITVPIRAALPNGRLYAETTGMGYVYNSDGELVNTIPLANTKLVDFSVNSSGNRRAVFSQVYFVNRNSATDVYLRLYSVAASDLETLN